MLLINNDIIEAKYKVNLVELRIILLAMSKINVNYESSFFPIQQKNINLKVIEYSETFNVCIKNSYKQIKSALKTILKKQ